MSGLSSDALLRQLEQRAAFRRSSKLARLIRKPYTMLFSNFLEVTNTVVEANAETFFGDDVKCFPPDIISLSLYRYNIFEEAVTYSLIELLNPGDVFIDIGAHIGYFSLLASRLVGDSGRVIAFEPTPRTREVLEYNVRHCSNVTVEPLAAWVENTTLEIFDCGWRYSAFNSIFHPRLEKMPEAESITVQGVSLDDYFSNHNIAPSFIKIDAESAESYILSGMIRTLQSLVPMVSIEVGDFDLPDVPSSRQILEFMIRFGYQPFEIKDGEMIRHVLRDRYEYGNMILRKDG